jgi:ribonuclease J
MAALQPTALMCEGTQVGSRRRTTEAEVYDNVLKTVRECRGLVVADFGPRNVERLITFHHAAREAGRQLVILPKDAYLLDAMRLVSDEVPDVSKADILLYKDLKSSLMPWEQRLREKYGHKLVTADQVHRSLYDYVMCFSFWDVKNLIDISPSGGTYIYSSSEAYDEEQQIDMRRLCAWLEHFGMRSVGLPREELGWHAPEGEQGYHASGHATQEELLELVRRVNPKMLVPIHTEHPEFFLGRLQGTDIDVGIPELGKPIVF